MTVDVWIIMTFNLQTAAVSVTSDSHNSFSKCEYVTLGHVGLCAALVALCLLSLGLCESSFLLLKYSVKLLIEYSTQSTDTGSSYNYQL